jgi:hypothetical protein
MAFNSEGSNDNSDFKRALRPSKHVDYLQMHTGMSEIDSNQDSSPVMDGTKQKFSDEISDHEVSDHEEHEEKHQQEDRSSHLGMAEAGLRAGGAFSLSTEKDPQYDMAMGTENSILRMEKELDNLMLEERKADIMLKLEKKRRDVAALNANIFQLQSAPALRLPVPSPLVLPHPMMPLLGGGNPAQHSQPAASNFSNSGPRSTLRSTPAYLPSQPAMNPYMGMQQPNPPSVQPTAGSPLNRLDLNPHVYLNVNSGDGNTPKGNKYRAIVDFIPNCARASDEEVEIAKGVVLKMKSGGSKVKLEQVTPAQWLSANSRILADIILKEGVNFDITNFVLDYLAYTTKIGELATKFTWSSVIQYDDDYRVKQSEFGFPWGSDSPHMLTVGLERRKYQGQGSAMGPMKSQKGKEPPFCINFNNGRDCPFKPCKFRHVCEICGKAHAKVNHDSTSSTANGTNEVSSKP